MVNKYARGQEAPQGKDEKLTGEDIREGLAAIISVKLANPQFEGQTKTKLGNTEVKSFVQKVCNEWLADWLERNPGEAKTIITKASSAARARTRGAGGPQAGPPQVAARVGSMPGKLADCQSTDPRRSELFIVEGDSRRRLGQAGPRLDGPGDPADPRQDPQRGEGAHRPGAEEQRGPVADHRAGHRHPRRVRHRRSCATTRSC